MKSKAKVAPTPSQGRAKTTVETVIAATRKAISTGGESSVRVQDISASTGVSIGSIYHHFGDRDGLVRATLVHNFAEGSREDIARVKRWADNIHSSSELVANYDQMKAFLNEHFQNQSAIARASILGNAAGRELLQDALAQVQTELTDDLTAVMKLLAERNILKEYLDPRAAAVVLLGLLFGKVVAILDETPVSDDQWNQAALSALGGMIRFAD